MRTQSKEEAGIAWYGRAFLFGQLFGIFALLVSYILFAIVITVVDFSSLTLIVMAVVGLGIAGFSSGFSVARMIGSRGMLLGFFSGLLLSMLFLLLSVLIFSCKWDGILGIKFIVMGICSVFGGIFGVNSKKIHR